MNDTASTTPTCDLAFAEKRVRELAPLLRLVAATSRSTAELTFNHQDAISMLALLAEYDRRAEVIQTLSAALREHQDGWASVFGTTGA